MHPSPTWRIEQEGYVPSECRKNETLFCLSNGFRSLRGSTPFTRLGSPGSFIAGVFDKSEAPVIEIVRCPDPTPLVFYVDEQAMLFEADSVAGFTRTLDMRHAVLTVHAIASARTGARCELTVERFVSMASPGLWAERISLRALNFSRRVLMGSAIEAGGRNNEDNPLDTAAHLEVIGATDLGPGVGLLSRTLETGVEIAEATLIAARAQDAGSLKRIRFTRRAERAEELYALGLEEGKLAVVHRFGATAVGRDGGGRTAEDAAAELRRFARSGWEEEYARHAEAWERIWDDADVELQGDDEAQRALRFNIFHLAACAPRPGVHASIGARGLHGEGYKGHVFWDTEIFMFPFFVFTRPEAARDLLAYRFSTLDGARGNALTTGFKGARFPWESALDGGEETPHRGIDYAGNEIRIRTGDEALHISPDIAYAVMRYWRATGDGELMEKMGLQLILEIAAFISSALTSVSSALTLPPVIGPDEFHEHVSDNAYTNYLSRWTLRTAVGLEKRFAPEAWHAVCAQAGVTPDDLSRFARQAEQIRVTEDRSGLIEQFRGYFALEDRPITRHDENGMPLWPEGTVLSRLSETRLVKQPDVLMLFILLGEEFSRRVKDANYDFYEARTMHKSSLSPSMHALLGITLGKTDHALEYFRKTLMTDLDDNQGNTFTGFHAASAGGAWQCAVHGFGGFSLGADDLPCFSPWIPESWESLSYTVRWRGARIRVRCTRGWVELAGDRALRLRAYGSPLELEAGKPVRVEGRAAPGS